MNFSVEVAGWSTINEASLLDQVFSACRFELPGSRTKVLISMPLCDAVRTAIESGLSGRAPKVSTEQRIELRRAAQNRRRLELMAGRLLRSAMSFFGGRAAVASCAQLVRLGAREITGRLAAFQTWDAGPIEADLSWFDIRDSLLSCCRAIYEGQPLVRMNIIDLATKSGWTVWAPSALLPVTGQYPYPSTEIDILTWATCILPQCALLRVLRYGASPAWIPTDTLMCAPAKESIAAEGRSSATFGEKQVLLNRGASLCLNLISDPPTARVGPFVNLAPGTERHPCERTLARCVSSVSQVNAREWRAPSIWHAVLWLRDLAGWNNDGRPGRARGYDALQDAPRGAFLFRGQRNATWPLTPSVLRSEDDAERERNGLAILRFMHACEYLSKDADIPPQKADAYIGAAQHYGLPTWYLDFTVDPSFAAFFAADNSSEGDEAAIYWLPAEAAMQIGAKIIFAPFWVERLYAQLGCFLDRSCLITDPSSKDDLKAQCYRIVFPTSPSFATSEYGNVGGRIYPESEFMTGAVRWALTSTTMPEDPEALANELAQAVGRAPWVVQSTFWQYNDKMFEFMGKMLEWLAMRVIDDGVTNRRLQIDDYTIRLLFRDNPGVYSQLNVAAINANRFISRHDLVFDETADLKRNVGVKALTWWLLREASNESQERSD